MPILHMETEVARDTQKTLTTKHQEILGNLQQSSASVNELRSNWLGNSASQFFQEYDQWNDAMNKMLEEYSKMSSRLLAEIAEWEQTASRFE